MNFIDFFLLNKVEIFDQTIKHIGLTLTSLTISLFIGIPLGIIITRYKRLKGFVIGLVGAIQTIPSIALLGFLIPLVGIGPVPAIIALFLYALLPIVRGTCTGIEEVDKDVKEAAKGMGMSDFQILTKVELPLSIPVIFSGVRTAAVLNVGVATLCTLVAAGGLGEFIFRGIALNNKNMILIGAIPAALLALTFDFVLGIMQKFIKQIIKPFLFVLFVIIFVMAIHELPLHLGRNVCAGFNAEFMEREDGYQGLKKNYMFFNKLKVKELEQGLIFEALKSKQVDIISGHSTDGRIKAYGFQILEDDKHLFPPYYACLVIRGKTLRKYPVLRDLFSKLDGKITNEKMAEMNYMVEHQKKPIEKVVEDFLNGISPVSNRRDGDRGGRRTASIIIGAKNFTEQYILAEIFKQLIESNTDLDVELKKGLAGTKVCFDALLRGDIDIYPEYTGTALYVILNGDRGMINHISTDKLYDYVKDEFKNRFDIEWLNPLGFNNTWVLIMRQDDAKKFMIRSISDLKDDINRKT